MATKPRCKLIRRYGRELDDLVSGVKPIDQKCHVDIKPGQHGTRPQRLSDYGIQLREKLKIRNLYGVLERPFRNYFKTASHLKGSTGENLLVLLERRLDNVVYRAGFASTRREAKQLVAHKHIVVNEQIVNIASFQAKVGDIIEIRERSKEHGRVLAALEISQQRAECEWLEVDSKAKKAEIKRSPERSDLPVTINESLVVELYSK